jgi:hypothetical protein
MLGEFADRPFIGLLFERCFRPPILDRHNPRFQQQMMDHCGIEGVAPFRRPPAFVIERGGDGGAALAGLSEFGGTSGKGLVGAQAVEAPDGTDHVMRCPMAALPMAFTAHLFAVVDDLDDHTF